MTSIFLGSSEELAVDRRALGDFMGGVNDAYAPRGWRFRLVEWERESIAVARQEGGKQAEYNELVRACDLCLFLFRTRCGEYTMQEVEAALAELRKPLLRVRYPDFCAEERAYHRRGDRRAVRRFEQMARREVSAPRTSDEMYLRRAYRRDHRVQLLDVSLGNPQRFFAGVRLVVASYLVVEVHRPVLRDTLRHRLERFLVAARPAVDVERRNASLALLAVNVERDEASRYVYEMMLR